MNEENSISVIQGSGNIFEDLGFDPQEASNLRIRAQLMLNLKKLIQSNHWTVGQAAERLNETEFAIEGLMNGAIEQFSVDQLLAILMRAGMEVNIEVVPRVA
jgi:predicted XRE-type DNA-binding protein